jgi:ubiquinone/menaquinone biosynthesis C-methylase UbiE
MDATSFRRASHAVWEAMAAGWDERHVMLERAARPVTEWMLQRLDPSPGQTILDVAAGTGIVGFSAAPLVGPSGRVIVSDFSESMVQVVERRAADLGLGNVDCRVLDAERLDLPDASVDGVLCRWGYMLMADPGAALRETRRVLGVDGRLSCAVFAGPEQNPWAALPSGVLKRRGHMPPTEAGTPGILALADRDRLRELLGQAHFGEPVIEEVPFVLDFSGVEDHWEFLSGAAGAIAMVLQGLSEEERDEVFGEISEQVIAYSTSGKIELPATSLVVSTRGRARQLETAIAAPT